MTVEKSKKISFLQRNYQELELFTQDYPVRLFKKLFDIFLKQI